jgi:hypothetical protein
MLKNIKQTKTLQHHQQGYILLLCLMFITFICLLSLSMITHDEWQERLLNMLLTKKKQDIELYTAISQFAAQKKDFTQDACTIDWQQSDEAWQELHACAHCCITQYNHVTLRYLVLTQAPQEPTQLAILAHTEASSVWQPFTLSHTGLSH